MSQVMSDCDPNPYLELIGVPVLSGWPLSPLFESLLVVCGTYCTGILQSHE